MKTKTARKRTVSKSAARSSRYVQLPAAVIMRASAAKPLSDRKCAIVHVHPSKVEFFESGATLPYSRISNGPAGSQAALSAQVAIGVLRDMESATVVRTFDASGKEIA